MQNYTYSVFSIAAIAVHLIINFDLLFRRGRGASCPPGYRGFLFGTLAYYATDAAWGVFAGLHWLGSWYADSVFFFLSLVAFVWMWANFVVSYLRLGKRASRILGGYGAALLAFNLAALAANPFTDCFFSFDADGVYHTGIVRDVAFALLVAYNILLAALVLVEILRNRDDVRRRSTMVFLFCLVMSVAIVLQVIWPLTPFTALGCLIGNCFLHVFVITDEKTARHMAELEDALARAQEAEKARSMFFSIVSHDIRTPLNAILGYSELLRFGGQNEAEKAEALNAIRSSGTTLLQLVDDVLDLAKMDSGKLVLRPEPVKLSQLTEEVFSSFRLKASEKGIALENRTGGVPVAMLDDRCFRQLLFNLIGNAVKFTENGTVTVEASLSGGCLELAVSDTGCGIPRNMLSHILDPFVQVQDPSHAADRAGGTGLGLSICRRLVQRMGGEISVESELGRGSTFRIRIPGVSACEEKPKREEEGARPDARTGTLPRHVLVVDDSALNRSMLTALLKRAGVPSVDAAGDGEEALAALRSAAKAGTPHDFVFSDFWMPNMNGLEFVGKLRDDSGFKDLPVYVVTADTEFRNDPRTGLFTGILNKPLTYAKLLGVFSRAS